MVARRTEKKNESGQSIIEFLFMFPLMVGIALMMVRVNTAIQISIVNQQYARAQALFIAYNSPIYPVLRFRAGDTSDRFTSKGTDLMVIGVSEEESSGQEIDPIPSTFLISRPGHKLPKDEKQTEPKLRDRIRIRTTVAMCTQMNSVGRDGKPTPVNVLSEGDVLNFCQRGIYEQ